MCVYSLRAKERPYVSMPLEWSEVEACLKKKDASLVFFEAVDALKRVEKKGDLFANVLTMKQSLKDALRAVARPSNKAEKPSTAKVINFPKPQSEDEEDDEDESVTAIKGYARQALRALEKNNSVAAYNLLKRIAGD